jgi:UDP-N-acetylmuramyl pentapeptide synthase
MAEYLKGILKEGDVVLFKASRAVSLEKVIELL